MGAMRVSFSMLASSVGGSATLGMIGLAWHSGFPAIWWLGSGVIGFFLLGILFARKIRSTRARTMPQLCQKQFGSAFRKVSAIIIAFAYIPIVAAQFGAQALIIDSLSSIGYLPSLFLGATILFAYTCLGGQVAVIKSDLWQFIFLFTALIIILFWCVSIPEGWLAIERTPILLINDKFPFSRFCYYLVILGSTFIVGPMLYGRILSSNSQKSAQAACFFSAAGLFIIALIITFIGIALQGIIPEFTLPPDFKSQDILNYFILTRLPEWTGFFCLLGLFSAIISSADSCLFTAASIFANDLLNNPSNKCCRIAMFFITLLALFLALQEKGILNLLLMANDIYVCGVVPPIFLGLLLNKPFNSNITLVLLTMTGCGILGCIASWLDLPLLSIFSVLLSFFLCFVAILWDKIKFTILCRMHINKLIK